MKAFSLFVKYIIVPCSTVIGLTYAFDTYIVGRASSVVIPVSIKVELIKESQKIHQERVERELIMIRSSQDEMNKYLRKYL